MGTVRLNEVITKMNLENLTPQIDVTKIKIRQPDINRPAVQMTGYFEHFAAGRIQIIGLVEYSYMQQMTQEQKDSIYNKFLSLDIPCVVFCRELEPDETFRKCALENGVPLLMTRNATSNFMSEIIRWLNVRLAFLVIRSGTPFSSAHFLNVSSGSSSLQNTTHGMSSERNLL